MTKKNTLTHRKTIDLLLSWTGVVGTVVLLAVSAGLFWAHSFVDQQIEQQLAAQKITFPAADSKQFAQLPTADQKQVRPYAGQTVTNGAQARVFADNYIAVHLDAIGNGKTYAQISEMSQKDPTNAELKATTDTIFRGEMLRGVLLNAYAFGTMALVALYGAWGALAAGVLLLLLALLGFRHAARVAK